MPDTPAWRGNFPMTNAGMRREGGGRALTARLVPSYPKVPRPLAERGI
ncbi:MAG TPA: hypothetical protein VGD11_09635 [Mycobacteriales bacterium]